MSEDKVEHKGCYFLQNFILLSQQLYKVQVIPYIRWKYAAYFDSSRKNKQKTPATKKTTTHPLKKRNSKNKSAYINGEKPGIMFHRQQKMGILF